MSPFRMLVGVVGLLLFLSGLAATISGADLAAGLSVMVLGAVGVIIVIFERARYGAERAPSDPGRLRRTEELFVDPTTGQRTRVWIDRASGDRVYRPESE